MQLHGLHHVTAVTGKVQDNLAFYTRVLGLRLVKKSVNQDDTSAYHLFYADKVGSPGTALDVPLTHINASYVRSHFDAIEVRVPGAPLHDEIVFILAMSTGPRVHARVGGLAASAISKWDGLR